MRHCNPGDFEGFRIDHPYGNCMSTFSLLTAHAGCLDNDPHMSSRGLFRARSTGLGSRCPGFELKGNGQPACRKPIRQCISSLGCSAHSKRHLMPFALFADDDWSANEGYTGAYSKSLKGTRIQPIRPFPKVRHSGESEPESSA